MTNYRFSFAMCMRHAFLSGAGYSDLEVIKQADLDRFCDYDPPMVGSFQRMDELLSSAIPPKPAAPPKERSIGEMKIALLRDSCGEFADDLASKIINGLSVSAFENDVGAASLLNSQRGIIKGTIARNLLSFLGEK